MTFQQSNPGSKCPSRTGWAMIAAALMLFSGCGKLTVEYGKTKGSSGRNSLNGFGALRASYEKAGFRDRDVTRLSDRVSRTDVIVWTPQTPTPISNDVTRWFDRWLRRGGRTLVYILPDSGSESEYWIDAGKLAPPAQRLEYRRRAAKSINERMQWRLRRRAIASNGWFQGLPQVDRRPIGKVKGPLGESVGENETIDREYEYRLEAYDEDSAAAIAAANAKNVGFNGPVGPGPSGWNYVEDPTATRSKIEFNPLMESQAGDVLVAEITSEKWRDSKIIVVSGGSLLTNYAFTKPWSRRLADQIVLASQRAGDTDPLAGFLTTAWTPLMVSEKKAGVPRASGMELLTVWPLSIVTTHGVMLGLVICLMLLPIFGRPRRITSSKQSDFGDHLDAVASLMQRAGGENYARSRISEYMKRMHHETAGPWVLPDAPAPLHGTLRSLPLRGQGDQRRQGDRSPRDDQPSPRDSANRIPAEPSGNAPTRPATTGGEGGSLLDKALSEGDVDAQTPVANQPLATKPPTGDSGGAAESDSLFARCELVFEDRLRKAGLQPVFIEKGVSIGPLKVTRREGNLARAGESSVLCVAVFSIQFDESPSLPDEIRQMVSATAGTAESAIVSAASEFLNLVFTPVWALIDPPTAARQRVSDSTLAGWEVYAGKQILHGDGQGRVAAILSRQSIWNRIGAVPALPSELQSAVGHCSVSVANRGDKGLRVECQVNGRRLQAIEVALQASFENDSASSGVSPPGASDFPPGVWEVRQFFTMRPSVG